MVIIVSKEIKRGGERENKTERMRNKKERQNIEVAKDYSKDDREEQNEESARKEQK